MYETSRAQELWALDSAPARLTHQLSDLWAQLPFRPRIKVTLREGVLINYSCHL